MSWFDTSPESITERSIPHALLALAAPLLVQNAARIAEQVIDLFWVGRYSNNAVAAIGLGGPILGLLLTTVISTTFVGTQVLVSQRIGAGDDIGARRASFTGLALAIALSIVVGGLLFVGVRPILELITASRLTNASDEVSYLAVLYLKVLAAGIAFAAIADVIEASFLGRGDSRAPMFLNVTSVGLNLALDPVLIFGLGPIPELGMQGAALATVGGWVGSAILGVVLIARGRANWIITRDAVTFDINEFRKLFGIGLPVGVKGAAGKSSATLMSVVMFAAGGAAGLAAFTIGDRVISVAFRATNALKQAAQSIVGQNLGAGNPDRAVRTTLVGIVIAVSVLTTFAIVLWFLPGPITRLLVPTIRSEALDLSVTYLRILALAFPAHGALMMLKASFNGAGRTKVTMIASLIEEWGLQVPIAIGGLLLGGSITVVFWSHTIGIVITAVAIGSYFLVAARNGAFVSAADRIAGNVTHTD